MRVTHFYKWSDFHLYTKDQIKESFICEMRNTLHSFYYSFSWDITAVSYTHLDVYKRQVCVCVRVRARACVRKRKLVSYIKFVQTILQIRNCFLCTYTLLYVSLFPFSYVAL